MRKTIAPMLLGLLPALCLITSPVGAQFIDEVPIEDNRLGPPQTVRLQVGIIVTATGSPLLGVTGSTPVPIDWPEQQVKVVDEQASSHARRVTYETVGGTMKRMVVTFPKIGPRDTAQAMVTFEITRRAILAPESTDEYRLPKKIGRDVRPYLSSSPYIETRNARIRKAAREVTVNVEGDWKKAEAIYDWVRERVEYKKGPLKGAYAALRDGTGDCEELSSLFIAMCRINNIPARTVWIPGHCYPEFYLTDAEGVGHWFPCQAAGTRAFGSMPEYRPILQKGDNFKIKEFKDRQRYVAEHLKIRDVRGGSKPKVEFVRRVLPN